MRAIRNSAKAIIIRDKKLLVIKNTTNGANWYILPGGGQNHGEPLEETLKRECMEEASILIEVGDIVFIRDYISENHQFAKTENKVHQVEFMFGCFILNNTEPKCGELTDKWQTGIEWLPLAQLSEFDLYPSVLKELLSNGLPVNHSIYLGDTN